MKGMVLAAGKGTRIRPLSDFYAKPALPVPGGSIISHILNNLVSSGINEIAINLHHLPGTIRNAVAKDILPDISLNLVDEPEIAGSAGGFFRIRDFFENRTFIIVNGDSLNDADLKGMIAHHNKQGKMVTFLCQPDESGDERVIEANHSGDVISIRKKPVTDAGSKTFRFCGTMIIEPELFDHFPQKYSIDLVEDVLIPLLQNGKDVGTVYSPDFTWLDFGTTADYYSNCFRLLESFFQEISSIPGFELRNNYCIGENSEIITDSLKGKGYIGNGVVADKKSEIIDSILLVPCRLMDVKLYNVVSLAPEIEPGSLIENSIITPSGDILHIPGVKASQTE